MCDPLTIASTALAAVGSVVKGYASSSAGKLSAQIARGNAEIAGIEGNIKENRVRAAVDRTIASQTAHFSANNLDPSYGSPLLIAGLSAAQGEVDARTVTAETRLKQLGLESEASAAEQQAKADVFAGWFGAGTALLSGAAKGFGGVGGAGGPMKLSGAAGASKVGGTFGSYATMPFGLT
jgi:hypothetical protein